MLSGGMDSSIIFSIMMRRSSLDVSSLTLEFLDNYGKVVTNENLDEGFWSKKFRIKKIEKITINNSKSKALLELYKEVIDLPTRDGLNVFIASKYVSQLGGRISFSGAGADEVFNGYSIYNAVRWLNFPLRGVDFILRMDFVKSIAEKISWRFIFFGSGSEGISFDTKLYLFFRVINKPPEGFFDLFTLYFDMVIKKHLKNRDIGGASNRFRYLDIVLYLRCQLIRDADVAGLSNNVDVRIPFVSKRFWSSLSTFKRGVFLKTKKKTLGSLFQLCIPTSSIRGKKTGFYVGQ
jgi:asparagine synthetase B (glutamine-hydrolysing)